MRMHASRFDQITKRMKSYFVLNIADLKSKKYSQVFWQIRNHYLKEWLSSHQKLAKDSCIIFGIFLRVLISVLCSKPVLIFSF